MARYRTVKFCAEKNLLRWFLAVRDLMVHSRTLVFLDFRNQEHQKTPRAAQRLKRKPFSKIFRSVEKKIQKKSCRRGCRRQNSGN